MLFEVVVPTCNHAESMQYLMESYKEELKNEKFILSIHDSSSDDKTKALIEANEHYQKNLRYYRYDYEMHIDEKTLLALKKSDADYVMLAGDGIKVQASNIITFLMPLTKTYSVIALYPKEIPLYRDHFNQYVKQGTEYPERSAFFAEHFWFITLYGGTILHRNTVEHIHVEEMLKLYSGTYFIYPSTIIKTVEGGFYVDCIDSIIPNPLKGYSGWITQKKAIEIWAKSWYECVNSFRDIVADESVDFALNTSNKYAKVLNFKSLILFRATGNLDRKIYKEYKFYIKRMKACSSFALFMARLCPSWFARFIQYLWHAVKSEKIN